MTDYSTEAQAIADSINAVYENKQTNKKNTISGDYSSDNESYPTVKAVKAEFGTKVTSFSGTTSDSNYPSEKLVKTELDKKIATSQTAGLVKNDGTIDTTNYTITVEKQQTAETGFASTYVVKQGNAQVGVKINIPKDFLLQDASIETVGSTPTQEEIDAGLTTGDKYLKFVVNTESSSTGAKIIIVPLDDIVVDTYSADNVTLQLSSGVFSIKNTGVDTAQLKDGAVTSDKIASAVKNTWLDTNDVQNEISAFASALAEAINPSS